MIIRISIYARENRLLIVIVRVVGAEGGGGFFAVARPDESFPAFYEEDSVEVIENTIPKHWKKITGPDRAEWYAPPNFIQDKSFLSVLYDGNDNKEVVNDARLALSEEYKKQCEFYALRQFGSVAEAKKQSILRKYNQSLKLSREQGYERPVSLDTSDDIIAKQELNINDFWQADA